MIIAADIGWVPVVILLGTFAAGVFVGVLAMSILAVASDADRRAEELNR